MTEDYYGRLIVPTSRGSVELVERERATPMDFTCRLHDEDAVDLLAAEQVDLALHLALQNHSGHVLDLIERVRRGEVLVVQWAGGPTGLRPVVPVTPARVRPVAPPVTPGLSFYEVQVVDELDQPIAGVDVLLSTPGGAATVKTDRTGTARVDGKPEGFGSARVASGAQLAVAMAGRERGPRRTSPLPEGDPWHVVTASGALGAPITLPDAEPQKLMIVTRTDFSHVVNGSPWANATLESDDGPWMLASANGTMLALHANGLGTRLRMIGEAIEPFAAHQLPLAAPPVDDAPWIPPDVYIVQAGDTLVDIAKRYLGDGARWTEIWALNRNHLPGRSPDVIFPGDTFHMPPEAVPSWIALPTSAPPGPGAPPPAPPLIPEWFSTGVDTIHDALFSGAFQQAIDFLAGLPLDPPVPDMEDTSSTFLEELLYRAAMVGLALRGIVETPVVERQPVD